LMRLRFQVALIATLAILACSEAAFASTSPAATAEAFLKSGRNYAAAESLLTTALTRDPNNSHLHNLLGCAYADHAASMSYALFYREMLKQEVAEYPKNLKDWQTAQQDLKSPDYGKDQPTKPHDRQFLMKDCGVPLLLSDKAACIEANLLATEARAQWAKAVLLAHSNAQRAEAEEISGWGLILLRRSQADLLGHPMIAGLALFPKTLGQQPLHDCKLASKFAPDDAVYWQSVGDVIWLDRGGDFLGMGLDDKYGNILKSLLAPSLDLNNPTDDVGIMLTAYRRSLALQPHNAAVWYRLYKFAKDDNAQQTASLLQRCIKEAPQSAALHYENAHEIFTKTHYGDIYDSVSGENKDDLTKQVAALSTEADRANADAALAEIEAGNRCKEFEFPKYQMPIPMVMQQAWQYWDAMTSLYNPAFPIYAPLRDVARRAAGFARVSAYNHDDARVQRAIRATAGFGGKMTGNWPATDSQFGSGEIMRALVGIAITSIALKCIETCAEKYSDNAAAAKAKARYDAYEAQVAAYTKSVLAHIPNTDFLDSY